MRFTENDTAWLTVRLAIQRNVASTTGAAIGVGYGVETEPALAASGAVAATNYVGFHIDGTQATYDWNLVSKRSDGSKATSQSAGFTTLNSTENTAISYWEHLGIRIDPVDFSDNDNNGTATFYRWESGDWVSKGSIADYLPHGTASTADSVLMVPVLDTVYVSGTARAPELMIDQICYGKNRTQYTGGAEP